MDERDSAASSIRKLGQGLAELKEARMLQERSGVTPAIQVAAWKKAWKAL